MVPMKRSLLSMPSIRLLLATGSCPFTEYDEFKRRSSGRVPVARPLGGPGLTPGTSCAN